MVWKSLLSPNDDEEDIEIVAREFAADVLKSPLSGWIIVRNFSDYFIDAAITDKRIFGTNQVPIFDLIRDTDTLWRSGWAFAHGEREVEQVIDDLGKVSPAIKQNNTNCKKSY